MSLSTVDMIIVVAYLVGITAAGLWFARRQTETSTGYFLAGRSLRWPVIGLALFATNISTIHITGLASSGFKDGLVWGNFEWLAPFLLIILGLVFAPFYFRTRIATLPEYLEGRYGPGARTMLAVMGVFGALFIHIGVSLYAGAVVFGKFTAISIYWSILIVSILTALYTVLGGLKAVVVTETIQTVVLLFGAGAVTVAAILALDGAGVHSLADLREAAKPDQMSMIHTEGDFVWWVMLLGYPVLGLWYWCSDQTIVQRVLGARSERDAQLGPLFAGFIKVLPLFFMVLPGVLAWVLFRDKIENPDDTMVVLIRELLPAGLQGLVVAGLLAALMSTVAGALNSTATLVSIDILKRIRPATPDRTLVRTGQVTAVVVMAAAMAWSTQGERFGGIFSGVNAMIAVLAPPISAVFLWGVFWRRGTRQGALATLVGGFVLGAVVFVLDFPAVSGLVLGKDEAGDPVQLLTGRLGIPFMLQAFLLFVTCSLIHFVTSLLTPPPPAACVEKYCWRNPLAVVTETPFAGPFDARLVAGVLVALMVVLYLVFA